jgi:hypothetical protein
MKILFKSKDGGLLSTVTGYWLVESKSLFSIVLLKFEGDSRQAYHSHAFHAISWLLSGKLKESCLLDKPSKFYKPSIKPIITPRSTFHKVDSLATSWVLSFRGPWSSKWEEYTEEEGLYTLISGRRRVR